MVVVKGDAYYEVLCQFVDISFMLAVLVELGIPHDFKQFKKNNTLFFWCLFFFCLRRWRQAIFVAYVP